MTKKENVPTINFEESLEKLEKVVHQLETGELGLSDSLAAFETGIKHLKECHHLLEGVERKVELLSKVNSAGEIESEPFKEEELSLDEKAKARGNRRSSRSRKTAVEESFDDDDVDVPGGLF